MCKIPFVIWLLFSQWKEYLVYFYFFFFFLEFLICGWELNIHSCLLSFQRMMFSLVAGVFYGKVKFAALKSDDTTCLCKRMITAATSLQLN
ncbi:hypothetical protein L2E82_50779 [Cichorium intybus]|nr:hypothetical protein L2E82_50779 [Cichorium intybus]